MINTIILAGGRGTRLSEETEERPKPMVLIDANPILWHIMKIFLTQGFSNFTIALGHKGDVIKKWLIDLHNLNGNLHLDFQKSSVDFDRKIKFDNLKVSAIETGLESQTGGRILNCMKILPKETVMATYGDGLGNVDIKRLIEFHNSHKKLATITAVRPPSRFGQLEINELNNQVENFGEKITLDSGWINGGFFVLEPEVINYILHENEPFETGALPRLAKDSQLMAYRHEGFWMPMDTLRERNELRSLAQQPIIPWLDF